MFTVKSLTSNVKEPLSMQALLSSSLVLTALWLGLSLSSTAQEGPSVPPVGGAATVSQKKAQEVFAGTDYAYRLAKKYKVKVAFGTDVLFEARLATRQGLQLAKLVRWYTPAEALKMATADNGELLALSGLVNPYPGKLGVIEEGALADLLLVDGNPVENIKLIEDPNKNFLVIMKDGTIYQNLQSH